MQEYHRYRLKLKDRAIVSIQINGQEVRSLIEPDNRDQLSKLYIIESASEIVYIGRTKRNLRRRLHDGLQARGRGGYYGYMWKELTEVDVLVWSFPHEDDRYLETLEGELVFLFRKHTGKWPLYHMEIHFHNAEKDEVEVARAIFREASR